MGASRPAPSRRVLTRCVFAAMLATAPLGFAAPQAPIAQPLPPSVLVDWLDIERGSRLTVDEGDVHVNATDGLALHNDSSQVEVRHGRCRIRGKYEGWGTATCVPRPETGVGFVGDPYAQTEWPQPGRVVSRKKLWLSGDRAQTLKPGTYVGGLTCCKGLRLRLEPGVYVFVGGDLEVFRATLEGDGVTIIMSGNRPGSIFFSSCQIRLTAPKMGPLKRLLLVSTPAQEADTHCITMYDVKAALDGAIYAPGGGVQIDSSSQVTTTALVCQQLWLIEKASLKVTGAAQQPAATQHPVQTLAALSAQVEQQKRQADEQERQLTLMAGRSDALSMALFQYLRNHSPFRPQYAYLFIMLVIVGAYRAISFPLSVRASRMRARTRWLDATVRAQGPAELTRRCAFAARLGRDYPIVDPVVWGLVGADLIFLVWGDIALHAFLPQMALDGARFYWVSNLGGSDGGLALACAALWSTVGVCGGMAQRTLDLLLSARGPTEMIRGQSSHAMRFGQRIAHIRDGVLLWWAAAIPRRLERAADGLGLRIAIGVMAVFLFSAAFLVCSLTWHVPSYALIFLAVFYLGSLLVGLALDVPMRRYQGKAPAPASNRETFRSLSRKWDQQWPRH